MVTSVAGGFPVQNYSLPASRGLVFSQTSHCRCLGLLILNKIPHCFRFYVLSYNLMSSSHHMCVVRMVQIWDIFRFGNISVALYQLHILNLKAKDLHIHSVWSMLEDLRLHMFGLWVLYL